MRVLLLPLLMLLTCAAFAQDDSIAYSRDYSFNEGVYLSFDQFKNNDPIPKSAIIHPNRGINAPDFFFQLFSASSFSYRDSAGKEHKVDAWKIWGYCQDRSVFIGSRDAARLAVIGSFCHFSKVVVREGPTMQGIAGPVYSPPTNSLEQFILDMGTGKMYPFTVKALENILQQHDEALFKEFSALKKRKKKDMRFIYLKRYNEKHPLYLPTPEL